MTYLENTIAEQHYLRGEELLDANAILEVLHLESGLWSVMVKDDGVIEVEIQKPGTKSQKSTCECRLFLKEKSCAHIAAALLHLRQIEDERAEYRKKKEKERQKKAFNVRTIMDSIDTEELKNYVRSYAQKDKTFGTMFKATFAKSIELMDNSVKYESLLNSLIKPVSTAQLKSTTADLRNALKVIEEFNAQLEDHESLSNYDEAFTILKTTLPKIHYIYSRYELQNEKVLKWLAKFHKHIRLFYQSGLAPEFLSNVDEFVFELYGKSYFNYLETIETPYVILEQNQRVKACAKISTILNSRDHSGEEKSIVWYALLMLTDQSSAIMMTDDDRLSAIKYLMAQKYTHKAINLLEEEIKTQETKSDRRNRKMELTLIEAYQKTDNIAKHNQLAINIYAKYGDIKYYKLLQSTVAQSDWTDMQSRLLNALEQENANSTLLASFYYNEELYVELLDLLDSESDLRHIMKYDTLLYRSHFVRLQEIYKRAVSKYLDSHVGMIANRFIDEILHHLSASKSYKLESAVRSHIQGNYAHRAILESY